MEEWAGQRAAAAAVRRPSASTHLPAAALLPAPLPAPPITAQAANDKLAAEVETLKSEAAAVAKQADSARWVGWVRLAGGGRERRL